MGCLTLIVSLLVLWKKRHVEYVAKREELAALDYFFVTLAKHRSRDGFTRNERTRDYQRPSSAGIKLA